MPVVAAVQQNAQRLAAGTGPGQRHECHLPVVILSALSVFGLHRAQAAFRTMSRVGDMLFVTIQDRNVQAQIQGCVEALSNLPQAQNSRLRLVSRAGLEPATLCLKGKCSTV